MEVKLRYGDGTITQTFIVANNNDHLKLKKIFHDNDVLYLQLLGIHSRCNLTEDEIRITWKWIKEWYFFQKLKQPFTFLHQSHFYFLAKINHIGDGQWDIKSEDYRSI